MDEIIKISRSFELVIAMFLGGFLSWLGYRLFEIGVSGKASLSAEHGKIKFQLLNASPGIFFALFGCVIILLSISQTTKITERIRDGDKEKVKLFEKTADSEVTKMMNEFKILSNKLLAIGKADDLQKAIEALKAFIEINQVSAEANSRLAQIYINNNENITQAIRLAKIATQLQPHRIDFYQTLADAYIKIDDKEKAIKTLEIAIEMDPYNQEIQQKLQLFKNP